jgi:hypothetical protein
MEQRPWEYDSWYSQDIPNLLWNWKVHYHVHMSLPPVAILSQMNPINTLKPFLRYTLALSSHLRLGLRSFQPKCRMALVLKIIYSSVQVSDVFVLVVYLKLINSGFQIFPFLVPWEVTSFLSKIVQILHSFGLDSANIAI